MVHWYGVWSVRVSDISCGHKQDKCLTAVDNITASYWSSSVMVCKTEIHMKNEKAEIHVNIFCVQLASPEILPYHDYITL